MNQIIKNNPKTSVTVTITTILALLTGTSTNFLHNKDLTEKVYEVKSDVRVLSELLFSTGALKTRPIINTGEDLYEVNVGGFNWATLKLESGECQFAGRHKWYKKYNKNKEYNQLLHKLIENKELFPIISSDDRGFWYIQENKDTERRLYLGPLEDRKADDWIIFECKNIKNVDI